MSLTSQLVAPASVIRLLIDESFPVLPTLASRIAVEASKYPVLCRYEHSHYLVVGTSIDYRLRFYFSRGSAKVSSDEGKVLTSSLFKGLFLLETVKGLDLSKLTEGLDHFLAEVNPTRRGLGDIDEKRLCQFCWFIGLIDSLGRGWDDTSTAFLHFQSTRRYGLERMLKSIEQEVVEDMERMSRLFLQANRELIEGFDRAYVGGELSGSSDVGGADFDFAVDGCLFDVKTVKAIKYEGVLQALRQLIGYVLLDYDDRYGFQSVSLYFSRHGLTRRFDLTQDLLCTPERLTALRAALKNRLAKPAA